MMKLKQSLKNPVNPALLFSLALHLLIFLSGCTVEIESTYKEEEIPYVVKKICREEYNFEVTTKRTNNTLWIYVPVEKIIHRDYEIDKNKVFDEELTLKSRNILSTIGRVLLSADNAPEFYAILATDINLGFDYATVGYVLDTKKYYAGVIPWTESSRRYVTLLNFSPQAVGDKTGEHFQAFDIKLEEFLALQIEQRINIFFQKENNNKYFKIEKSQGSFDGSTFIFEYDIRPLAQEEKTADITTEILNIITYVLKSYEFNNFYAVKLIDLSLGQTIELNRGAIWARPIIID